MKILWVKRPNPIELNSPKLMKVDTISVLSFRGPFPCNDSGRQPAL
jgi:hypothetical protein